MESKLTPEGDRQVWVTMEHTAHEGSIGYLGVPADATGIVVFAHDSEHIKHSPRHQFVAQTLRNAGFATLMIYLLTPYEESMDLQLNNFRFDIGLLASRLVAATQWVAQNPETRHLPIGYFGVGAGGGAALVAAAACPDMIKAVISRGGRPDLAGPVLHNVQAPTLFVLSEQDPALLEVNQQAFDQIASHKQLVRVPAAGLSFEQTGALERVAQLAIDWYDQHLTMALQATAVGQY